jgi:hypothetical protein
MRDVIDRIVRIIRVTRSRVKLKLFGNRVQVNFTGRGTRCTWIVHRNHGVLRLTINHERSIRGVFINRPLSERATCRCKPAQVFASNANFLSRNSVHRERSLAESVCDGLCEKAVITEPVTRVSRSRNHINAIRISRSLSNASAKIRLTDNANVRRRLSFRRNSRRAGNVGNNTGFNSRA